MRCKRTSPHLRLVSAVDIFFKQNFFINKAVNYLWKKKKMFEPSPWLFEFLAPLPFEMLPHTNISSHALREVRVTADMVLLLIRLMSKKTKKMRMKTSL